jgi:hypothetical protein
MSSSKTDRPAAPGDAWSRPLSVAELAAARRGFASDREQIRELEGELTAWLEREATNVRAMRRRGMTWAAITKATGISRPALEKRIKKLA